MSEELREKAKAATPGQWQAVEDSVIGCDVDSRFVLADVYNSHFSDTEIKANAAYIAAANPTAILALLDERDSLLSANEGMRKALTEIADHTRNCVHDGGFDREFGPVGCLLGDKCLCIGLHPIALEALSPALNSKLAPAGEPLNTTTGE